MYRPQELKDVLIDCFSLDSFKQSVEQLKLAEQGKTPTDPLIVQIVRQCRPKTIPFKCGLIDDLRVSQPLMNESIGEAAKNVTLSEQVTDEVRAEVENIKSAIISNWDILKFLFGVYKGRDLKLIKKNKGDYADPLEELVEQFRILDQ